MAKKRKDDSVEVSGQTAVEDAGYALRREPVVKEIRRMVKTKPMFRVDFDAMHIEIREVTLTASKIFRSDTLELGNRVSLKAAAGARLRIQAQRDRAVEIMNELRTVSVIADELYTAGSSWIRQQPSMKQYPLSTQTLIIDVALNTLATVINRADGLIEEAQTSVSNLDSKTRALDTWLGIYREYSFQSGSRFGSQDRTELGGRIRKETAA